MASHRRSFFTEPNPSSTTTTKDVVKEENPMAQMWRTPSLKEFSFNDLKIATNYFRPASLLGEGRYGRVFKGWVDEKTLAPSSMMGIGMAVAVKALNNGTTLQGFQDWQSEVNFLGRHYHPNIISLFGYCWEDGELVLVYEFMQRGSLESHLFPRDSFKSLSWDIRLKIVIGAARGLIYLHTLEKQIIYRDFKSSAILLDMNYNPKISDFGLVKLGPSGDKTHVSTRMLGTYGYAAPEYFETDLRRRTNNNLVKWLEPMLSQPKTLMDVRMKGQYSLGAARNATQLTLKCLEDNHKNRPSMKEVLEVLVQIEAMKEDPEVLEQIEAVTSMTEDPEVLEHIEAIEEKPKNSNYRSRQSTAARCGQRSILHRFLTSLKEPFQCVSSKLNCMRI